MHQAFKTYGGVELQPHIFLFRHHCVQATSWRAEYADARQSYYAHVRYARIEYSFCLADVGPCCMLVQLPNYSILL
jgi:hypothetical protein